MPRIKQHELVVYRAVKAGELEIDAHGRIWRVRKRIRAKSYPCRRVRAEAPSGEQLGMRATFDGREYVTTAARLVWLHFNGPIPGGMQVKHVNGRRADNRPKNLELATASEMTLHRAHVIKVSPVGHRGEKHPAAKLTAEKARQMRAARKRGQKVVALAERFGVSIATVSKVCTGKRWGASTT